MTKYFFSPAFGRLPCSVWSTSKDTQSSEVEQFKSQYNKHYQAHALGFVKVKKKVLEKVKPLFQCQPLTAGVCGAGETIG